MPYIWTETDTINGYMDNESTIVIGPDADVATQDYNFKESVAQLHENDAVLAIRSLLSIAWHPTDDADTGQWETVDDPDLTRMAAKLAAANIGSSRVGAGTGDVPEWTEIYRDAIFGQCERFLLNHKTVPIVGATLNEACPNMSTILILVKRRERSIRGRVIGV